jgi:hypothetical protein
LDIRVVLPTSALVDSLYGADVRPDLATTHEIFMRREDESHPGHTAMRGYDLPAVVELLEVHGAVSHDLLLGTWESGRPPGKGECEIRFQQLDLNAFGLDEAHRTTIRIPINVGVMKLLPAVKLLRIDHDQQFGRLPIRLHIPLDVVSIPAIEHFEQNVIYLLGLGLGNA